MDTVDRGGGKKAWEAPCGSNVACKKAWEVPCGSNVACPTPLHAISCMPGTKCWYQKVGTGKQYERVAHPDLPLSHTLVYFVRFPQVSEGNFSFFRDFSLPTLPKLCRADQVAGGVKAPCGNLTPCGESPAGLDKRPCFTPSLTWTAPLCASGSQ